MFIINSAFRFWPSNPASKILPVPFQFFKYVKKSFLHFCNAQAPFFDDQRNLPTLSAFLFVSYFCEEFDDLIYISLGSFREVCIVSQVVDYPHEAFVSPIFEEWVIFF